MTVAQKQQEGVVNTQQDVAEKQQDVVIRQHWDPVTGKEDVELREVVVIRTHCKGCGVVLSQQERELMLDFCDICMEYGPESLEGQLVWDEASPVKSDTYD